MIPYGRQDITQKDVDLVVDTLCSDFITQGPMGPQFELGVADYCGSRHAIAVNSATSALHLSCLALGLGPGDWLWTSPITFVASSNCGLFCGANVDFVDIDSRTYNLCSVALERKLVAAEKSGRLPKIVIPVHLCGQPCDMQAIHALAKRYDFKVIEDASHAIGARYKSELVGLGRYSDITVFSFHPVKIITTGEGGMALTNDDELAGKIALLRSHGITRDSRNMTHAPDGPWYYQQIDLGFNYRMTDIQAALGVSQMQRLDDYVIKRRAVADRYNANFADLPVTIPWQHPGSESTFHLYVIRLQLDKIQPSHRQVFEAIRKNGIGVNLHYIPIYAHPYYNQFGFNKDDFPQAESYYSEAISLPIYPTLTEEDQDRVSNSLKRALQT